MAQAQKIVVRQLFQTLQSQQQRFAVAVNVVVAYVFQTDLADLAVFAAALTLTKNVLDIIQLGRDGIRCDVLCDTYRNVRPQRHQFAVEIAEGQDLLAFEETAVLPVYVVWLETPHTVTAVSICFIDAAQKQGDTFFRCQLCDLFHFVLRVWIIKKPDQCTCMTRFKYKFIRPMACV